MYSDIPASATHAYPATQVFFLVAESPHLLKTRLVSVSAALPLSIRYGQIPSLTSTRPIKLNANPSHLPIAYFLFLTVECNLIHWISNQANQVARYQCIMSARRRKKQGGNLASTAMANSLVCHISVLFLYAIARLTTRLTTTMHTTGPS